MLRSVNFQVHFIWAHKAMTQGCDTSSRLTCLMGRPDEKHTNALGRNMTVYLVITRPSVTENTMSDWCFELLGTICEAIWPHHTTPALSHCIAPAISPSATERSCLGMVYCLSYPKGSLPYLCHIRRRSKARHVLVGPLYWVLTSPSFSTLIWSLDERVWTLSSGNSALLCVN